MLYFYEQPPKKPKINIQEDGKAYGPDEHCYGYTSVKGRPEPQRCFPSLPNGRIIDPDSTQDKGLENERHIEHTKSFEDGPADRWLVPSSA